MKVFDINNKNLILYYKNNNIVYIKEDDILYKVLFNYENYYQCKLINKMEG